ncbi:WG repeat-containing protein [Sediminibacter sp. Hel_I_10]|uniref:WG repeat-containing protein n=1 Tax=Sediminibacter sp. Hel_I_10 TaxID=1392490 RepID=UPI00047EDA01|nr:WG repeat-containing protein [Sediminibacter sp. Hel_I_10]|tara:strand:+ start:7181 stop:7783 length:603 start_codon:yes stop_codon:yes gene_type:complete
MKKLLIILLLIPFFGIAQTLEDLEYISPFVDDVAAIKKGNEWAFINKNGDIVIDFRSDLVSSNIDGENYPLFYNDRCLIAHHKEGVLYYGYINKKGETTIIPQFLNATNFKNEKALALTVHKETIGYNDIFNKDVVSYHYFEVVIDKQGKTSDHLTQLAIHISPKDKNNKNPPVITSKLISGSLVLVSGENKKWSLKRIE